MLELGPGTGYATGHQQLRAAAEAAGLDRVRRRVRLRRLPVLWLGASDEQALDSALACVDALDAELP